LFVVAFVVRWWLLSGLILGDDGQEFGLLQQVVASGPDFRDQLQVRFGGWLPNYLFGLLFGITETTVLLPTWILSAAMSVFAYALLVRWGYGTRRAFLGGLLVATAPFEVVLGTLRTNDLYLGGALTLGFMALVFCEDRPIRQGLLVALALWYGFYVKLWAVYALPSLVVYAFIGRRWTAALAFVATSVVLHAATLVYWRTSLGTYTPFISTHAANYAVQMKDLPLEWERYLRMIFVGSEFSTTLFGIVPYVLVVLLVVQAARGRLDRADRLLLGFWGGFFLFLEFFPAGFSLDGYYTVPRIFRYLAPISFPIALHAAKLVVDVAGEAPSVVPFVVSALLAVNLYQSWDATEPGRVHRAILERVVPAIERMAPPRVVAETTIGYWLRALYLDPERVETEVTMPPNIYVATECEKWIRDSEATWQTGTVLLTGFGNYVHYGAHTQGLRLAWFDAPLDDRWELAGEYGEVTYLPRPEMARLWRLARGAPPATLLRRERDAPTPEPGLSPEAAFKAGMARFDAGDHAVARAYFRAVMSTSSPQSEDATFFHAASYFRQDDWVHAADEFKHLLKRYPHGHWVAAAHWHIGICDLRRGRTRRASARFRWIIRELPEDVATADGARAELRRIVRRRDGLLVDLWHRLQGARDA
jgi:tetratricopeptide (TPR) repeat protein